MSKKFNRKEYAEAYADAAINGTLKEFLDEQAKANGYDSNTTENTPTCKNVKILDEEKTKLYKEEKIMHDPMVTNAKTKTSSDRKSFKLIYAATQKVGKVLEKVNNCKLVKIIKKIVAFKRKIEERIARKLAPKLDHIAEEISDSFLAVLDKELPPSMGTGRFYADIIVSIVDSVIKSIAGYFLFKGVFKLGRKIFKK